VEKIEMRENKTKVACRIIIFALTICLSVSIRTEPAHASGPWYVAPAGSDDNDCLAAATACRTIRAALGKATTGDVINVAAGIYTETLTIDKDVTINGAGAAATIIEPGYERVTIPGGRTVGLAGVSISNGSNGGMENSGTLTLSESVVSNNDAFSSGSGGIRNLGTMTLTASLIYHNYGHISSGGIFNEGTMVIVNTTVTDNVAGRSTASCGGVCNVGP
jgi:hypothetical protein